MGSKIRSMMALTALVGASAAMLLGEIRDKQPIPGGDTLVLSEHVDYWKVPVLVELFTSEGCSSCPPADALLGELRDRQPIPGEDIVVLSEHVDYWDHDGWKDRFSSHDITERQKMYVDVLRLRDSYTPQMVVDGSIEFNGSDARKAQAAFEKVKSAPMVGLTLSKTQTSNKEIGMHVEISGVSPKRMDLLVAIADPDDETQVKAGENGGKVLRHVNVVRKLQNVGSVEAGKPLARDVTVKFDTGGRPELVVTFLQDPATGKVWGVASEKL